MLPNIVALPLVRAYRTGTDGVRADPPDSICAAFEQPTAAMPTSAGDNGVRSQTQILHGPWGREASGYCRHKQKLVVTLEDPNIASETCDLPSYLALRSEGLAK